jgi:hypothetical protein
MIEEPEFESRYDNEFLLLHIVQTDFRSHPTSYAMCIGGFTPREKAPDTYLLQTNDEVKKR